jgi:chain length determinant protein (polysaccharide antigen chain regulator)
MTEQNIDNFLDLVIEKKKVLLGIILASITVSVIYALTATQLYKTSIFVVPATDIMINSLNVKDSEGRSFTRDSQITPSIAYNTFMTNAQSRRYQREFFFNTDIFDDFSIDLRETHSTIEESFENFHKNLSFYIQSKILSRDKREESFVTISFIHENSDEAAKILNSYTKEVIDKTSRELVDGANQLIMNKYTSILGEANAKLGLAETMTQDRIIQLKEAHKIAKELDIIDMKVNAVNHQSIFMSEDNVVNNVPLYLYGTRALNVEIQALLERKSEESFVPGLRQLQRRAAAVNDIKVKYSSVKAAQIDQEAIPTNKRFAPKRKLIVFLGGVLGVFIALLYLLALTTISRRKS